MCIWFDGRHTVSMAGARVLLTHHAIVAKCDHAAKMLAARKRRDDLITFLGISQKLDHVWRLASIYSPYTMRHSGLHNQRELHSPNR